MKKVALGILFATAMAGTVIAAPSALKLAKNGSGGTKAIFANEDHPGTVVDTRKYVGVGNRYTVVDYYAHWCPPCRKLAPFFKELPEKFTNVSVVEVNIDKWGSPVCQKEKINSIPFVVIYDPSGREIARGQQAQMWLNSQIDAAGDPWANDPRFK